MENKILSRPKPTPKAKLDKILGKKKRVDVRDKLK
jgi:hypothetical protein